MAGDSKFNSLSDYWSVGKVCAGFLDDNAKYGGATYAKVASLMNGERKLSFNAGDVRAAVSIYRAFNEDDVKDLDKRVAARRSNFSVTHLLAVLALTCEGEDKQRKDRVKMAGWAIAGDWSCAEIKSKVRARKYGTGTSDRNHGGRRHKVPDGAKETVQDAYRLLRTAVNRMRAYLIRDDLGEAGKKLEDHLDRLDQEAYGIKEWLEKNHGQPA